MLTRNLQDFRYDTASPSLPPAAHPTYQWFASANLGVGHYSSFPFVIHQRRIGLNLSRHGDARTCFLNLVELATTADVCGTEVVGSHISLDEDRRVHVLAGGGWS